MKPDKKQEAEVLQVYDAWWHSYLTGDVKTYDSLLDDEYRFVGSTNGEEFLNRKDTTKFFELTADQLAGKAELRNLTRTIEKLDSGHILITDLADAYVISESEWVFYSRFRFTSLMKETKNGWRFIYQHFSAPDTKAQEGETLGTEQITKENQELRDAIKRRTVELENKTRELEIEASLERVRTVAMGMNKPDDMLDICRIISQQLKLLNVKEIRNVQTAIIYEAKGSYLNFEYYAKHEKTFITDVDFKLHPAQFEFVIRMLKGPEEFFSKHFNGKEVQDWYAYQQTTNQFADSYLATATSLNYYWYSMGPVALGISTYVPLTEEDIVLFKRFRNVFELSYRRFIDIEQAAAQAREAQIEVALERVRAKVMAMNSSKELSETSFVFGEQLRKLGIDWQFSYFWLIEEDKDDNTFWITWPDNQTSTTSYSLAEADQNFKDCLVAWKNQEKIHGTHVAAEYVKSWLDTFDRITTDAGGVAVDIMKAGNFKDGVYYYDAMIRFGSFGILMNRATTNEEKNIQARFATEFERAYTRFLDLQKAEAQARESQIQLGLERVRARTMAMHQSEELREVIELVYEQLVILELPVEHAGFILDYKEKNDMHIWFASKQVKPSEITIPYFDSPHWNSFLDAKAKGKKFFSNSLDFKVKNKFYKDLFKWIPPLPDDAVNSIFSRPGLIISTVLLENVGLYIENYTQTPFTGEENAILMRFGKVFQQTYTRFLDLQKAEAQAREATIEAALERVRSRTMAMQRSEELLDVASILFQQVKGLGVPQWNCGFNIWNLGDREFTYYPGTPDGVISPSPCKIPLTEHPVFMRFDESRKRGEDLLIYEKKGDEQDDHYRYMLSLPGVGDLLRSMMDAGFQLPAFQIDHVANFAYGNLIFITFEHFPEMHDVFKRFAKVFEQTYTRFLDLQKAEAQAREAQIEAALERVRSRSMAMHKSDELLEAGEILFLEMQKLGIESLTAGYVLIDEEEKNGLNYTPHPGTKKIMPVPVIIPHNETIHMQQVVENWKKGNPFFIVEMDEEETIQHQTFIAERSTNFPLTAAQLIAISPARLFLHNFNFKEGYVLVVGGTKLSAEQTDIMLRFAKVFQQTYTRFLDLQKAEAQAKEAQIESALERVRSRSLAMHHSSELSAVVDTLLREFTNLEFTLTFCIINLIDEQDRSNTVWAANPETGKDPESYYMKFEDYPFHHAMWDAWKEQKKNFIYTIEGEEKKIYDEYLYTETEFRRFPKHVQEANKALKRYVAGFTFFKYSGLQTVSENHISDDELEILERFGRVFEQSYTRFLDLQKAEAQAREAQIQLALERVRARTMAMQHSNELPDAATILFQQVQSLDMPAWSAGYCIWNDDKSAVTLWMSSEGVLQPPFTAPTKEDELFIQMRKGQEDGETFHVVEMGGDKLVKHYQYMRTLPVVGEILDSIIKAGHPLPTFQIMHHAYFSRGFLLFITYEPVPAAHDIFKRFGKVFDQTYTRFLDLQKAEAQAREAQIEAALERVRSKTMAMHNSREVGETVAAMFEELVKLGVDKSIRCGIGILNDTRHMEVWTASTNKSGETTLDIGLLDMTIHPLLTGVKEAWKNKKTGFAYELLGEDLKNYFIAINAAPDYPVQVDLETLPDKIMHTDFFFSEGTLFAFSPTSIPEETAQVLKRFAGVFGQTYRRYLDLQKAEAQAREAQIEAALERVRSRSMAMHDSKELGEVAKVMFNQMKLLGGELFAFGIILCDKNENEVEQWHGLGEGDMMTPFQVPVDLDYIHRYRYDQWKAGVELFSIEIPSDYIARHFELMFALPSVKMVMDDLKSKGIKLAHPSWEIDYGASFRYGYLLISSLQPYAEEKIFPRFAKVFEQAYTRFLDLQKAEAQAREAQIETALEKVRSRTLAMQKSDELAETASVLFQQLITLGIEPNRLYITIIHSESDEADFWITNEDGSKLTDAYSANLGENSTFKKMYEGWKKQLQHLVIDMQGEELQNYFHYLQSRNVPFKGGLEQTRRVQHLAYFSKGFIGMASPDEQPAETLQLLERFAAVFNLTFTRFNDLKIAEAHALQAEQDLIAIKEAKQKAEEALTELQATQKQLIQSEKMASLGELTAGIAHEIQNPLNFVNNFSEVSKELLDEMREAIEKGDTEDAKEIMNDVIQNLEKINHHGKRADGIVKGMLQHSRSSSGQKEATDINALADEYLRLSYHGLRAKDKTFNATLKTDFDSSIGLINIIPQDMGRVILNLITNAFYVVNEKAKAEGGKQKASASSAGQPYEPTVEVSTKKDKDKVEVKVKDNGNGIPQKILDKIFQPFFTTKPTGEGTGLGLSLSYDIVKAHGGELKVETKENEGSEFIISIPVN